MEVEVDVCAGSAAKDIALKVEAGQKKEDEDGAKDGKGRWRWR